MRRILFEDAIRVTDNTIPNRRLCDKIKQEYIDVLAQDCGNSIADALELSQSCIKPSICRVRRNTIKTASEHIEGLVQKDVTLVLTQWSYVFLALTHRYISRTK